MQRLGRTALLFAMLANAAPALAFGGGRLPLPDGWVSVPLVLSSAAVIFLLRNERGRGYLGWTVLGLTPLFSIAMWFVTEGGRIVLLGAAILVFSPWIILLALVVGVWRNGDPKPRDEDHTPPYDPRDNIAAARVSPSAEADDFFPATRPFDQA